MIYAILGLVVKTFSQDYRWKELFSTGGKNDQGPRSAELGLQLRRVLAKGSRIKRLCRSNNSTVFLQKRETMCFSFNRLTNIDVPV